MGLFDKFRKRISVSNESGVFRIIEKTGFPEKYIPPEGKEKLNVIVPKEVRIIGNRSFFGYRCSERLLSPELPETIIAQVKLYFAAKTKDPGLCEEARKCIGSIYRLLFQKNALKQIEDILSIEPPAKLIDEMTDHASEIGASQIFIMLEQYKKDKGLFTRPEERFGH